MDQSDRHDAAAENLDRGEEIGIPRRPKSGKMDAIHRKARTMENIMGDLQIVFFVGKARFRRLNKTIDPSGDKIENQQ